MDTPPAAAPPRARAGLPLYIQVILGVAIGSTLGAVFGTRPIFFGIGNEDLGALGLLVIRLLKALAVPLMLFAIMDAVLHTDIAPRHGARLIMICLINVSVAFAIGLTLMNTLQPGMRSREQFAAVAGSAGAAAQATLASAAKGSVSPLKAIDSYVPQSLLDPLISNSVIPVVLLALLFGAAMRRVRDRSPQAGVTVLDSFVHAAYMVLVQVLHWVVRTIPFAVLGIMAQVVGKSGGGVFVALAPFLGIVLLGFALQSLVYYPLLAWIVAGRSPRIYLGRGADAILTALSTNSSLATMPVTLRCLTEKMGVSQSSARLAACVGTNLNHDGITLYEAMAALFITQALGVHLTLEQQILVMLASLMAGIGIAGIPEAGLVMLPLVLGAIGLPPAMVTIAIAFVLPADWILARGRSAVNVMSDMVVALVLDRTRVESKNAEPPQPAAEPLAVSE